MTIEVTGIEFDSAGEALQHIHAGGRGVAISIGGKVLVVEQAQADRIAQRRIGFAYLVERKEPDGRWRTMTIPVND